jgi:aminopeptidase N
VLRDTEVVLLDTPSKTVAGTGVASPPVISALRGFSAPVNLSTDARPADRYVLFAADPDLFNRWEAGQTLARDLILARAAGTPDEVGEERYADALGRPGRRRLRTGLQGPAAGAAVASRTWPGPSSRPTRRPCTPPANALRARIAVHLGDLLRRLHGEMQGDGEFSADAPGAGRRALRNGCPAEMLAPTRTRSTSTARRPLRERPQHDRRHGRPVGPGRNIGGAPAETWPWRPSTPAGARAAGAGQVVLGPGRDPNEGALERVMALTAAPRLRAGNPNRLRALVSGLHQLQSGAVPRSQRRGLPLPGRPDPGRGRLQPDDRGASGRAAGQLAAL